MAKKGKNVKSKKTKRAIQKGLKVSNFGAKLAYKVEAPAELGNQSIGITFTNPIKEKTEKENHLLLERYFTVNQTNLLDKFDQMSPKQYQFKAYKVDRIKKTISTKLYKYHIMRNDREMLAKRGRTTIDLCVPIDLANRIRFNIQASFALEKRGSDPRKERDYVHVKQAKRARAIAVNVIKTELAGKRRSDLTTMLLEGRLDSCLKNKICEDKEFFTKKVAITKVRFIDSSKRKKTVVDRNDSDKNRTSPKTVLNSLAEKIEDMGMPAEKVHSSVIEDIVVDDDSIVDYTEMDYEDVGIPIN